MNFLKTSFSLQKQGVIHYTRYIKAYFVFVNKIRDCLLHKVFITQIYTVIVNETIFISVQKVDNIHTQ